MLEKLEELRGWYNAPIKINSGCRCAAHNKAIGGYKNSQHLYARAADIVVYGVDPEEVADYSEQMGVPGIGRYSTFTHLDSRTGIARWGG